MAKTTSPDANIGQACPDFSLPGTDGRRHSRADFVDADATLIMFICNHCPYVVAVEDRIVALVNSFAGQRFRALAISSNDPIRYPADSLDKMRERAVQKKFGFPYVIDESQDVARAFGAVCTPDFFLFDRSLKLAYRGRLDDSWKDPALVTREELKDAIGALLAGEAVTTTQHPSMGCSIKWKEQDPC